MWDYVPHVLPFAGDVATRRALDRGRNHRSRGPESTRSSIKARAEKNRVSGLDGRLTWCHVEDAEATDPHRTDDVAIVIIIVIFFHRTADALRNLGPRDRAIVTLQSPEDRSNGVEELWKNSTIAVRSSRDWGAYMVESPPFEWRAIDERPGPRSWRDRGPIVGLFEAEIKADLDEIEAMIVINGSSPLHDRSWPSIRLHDRVNRPRSSGQFPSLKACISLLCSSTFDRFMKELSEFRGRSLVHRDPPAFRLDCEAIGAGLIANFSLISSNFPLEFRTSTRKNPTKFASIHENWSPILEAIGLVVRFDRLSGGNLSFY